jgi:hypothetical protein
MPRIKLTAIVAGPDYRGQPGEIIEVSIQQAQQLIKAQAALPMEPDGPEDAPSKTESSGGPAVVLTSSAGEDGKPAGTVTSNGPQAAQAIESFDGLSIAKVMALVNEGKITKKQALAIETAGANRASLIKQLQPDG